MWTHIMNVSLILYANIGSIVHKKLVWIFPSSRRQIPSETHSLAERLEIEKEVWSRAGKRQTRLERCTWLSNTAELICAQGDKWEIIQDGEQFPSNGNRELPLKVSQCFLHLTVDLSPLIRVWRRCHKNGDLNSNNSESSFQNHLYPLKSIWNCSSHP